MAEVHSTSGSGNSELPEILRVEERPPHEARQLNLRLERKSENYVILHIANEFISQNCYLLDEMLGRLLPLGAGLHVELDMSQVPYADSAALGRVIFWSKKFAQAGASLMVVDPTPYVTDIIETMHFDEVVKIVRRHTPPPIGA